MFKQLAFYFCFCMFGKIAFIHAEEAHKRICLNMIVKDECHVIHRSLLSVKPFIDYWVIVDTGSTDGTQEMIKKLLQDVPGELHERPWVDFAFNRNQAMSLALNKGDYLLFLDADDEVIASPECTLPDLQSDLYYLTSYFGNLEYKTIFLMKTSLKTQWLGVVHEHLCLAQAKSMDHLEGLLLKRSSSGARGLDPLKLKKDIEILKDALEKNPYHARYLFYLAQSYRDNKEYNLSLQTYQKAIEVLDWDEELFWSLYQIGILQQRLQLDPAIFLKSYFKAFAFRPIRAEPLYYIANYCRLTGHPEEGFTFAHLGLNIDYPKELNFVDKWIYDWGLVSELFICALELQNYEVALKSALRILDQPTAPKELHELVESRLLRIYEQLAIRNQ